MVAGAIFGLLVPVPAFAQSNPGADRPAISAAPQAPTPAQPVAEPPVQPPAQPAVQPAVQPTVQPTAQPAAQPAQPSGPPKAPRRILENLPPLTIAPPSEPDPTQIPDISYLTVLRAKAERLKLADTRFWRLLMHYQPTWFGFESQTDGPGFFLSPKGKTDPRAELWATLAAFFSPKILEPGKMTAQCTFPARYRWLKEQIGFDPERLPEEKCDRFEAWREALKPQSVTFIFASYYLNNPASAFGHTLLRFDRAERAEGERLLDYAVNFAANVRPDENPIVYAFKGIFGGYEGTFSLLPYYAKVREYSDIDSRDLWEYRLSLTPEQIDWMLRHTWEMGSTYFDYYFFGENCSYHLLSLIEIADPSLHLRDRFTSWTLPTDTVRAITDQPGLVRSLVYRPSRGSQMVQKVNRLALPEQKLVVQLIARPEVEPPGFTDLPPLSQALILDAASDYFQFKLGDARGDQEKLLREKLRSLLLRRSKLRVTYDADSFPPLAQSPDTGHRTSRISVFAGEAAPGQRGSLDPTANRLMRGFVEFAWQPVFQELLSDAQGYAPNAHVQIGDMRFRYYGDLSGAHDSRRDPVDLERFALLDAVSLYPATTVVKQVSWKLHLSFDRTHDGACRNCTPLVFVPGAGYTVQSDDQKLIAYVMGEVDLEADQSLLNGYRAGVGAEGGVLYALSPTWRAHLQASHVEYSSGQTGWTNRTTFAQRVTLGRDLEARFDAGYVVSDRLSAYREVKVGIGWFY